MLDERLLNSRLLAPAGPWRDVRVHESVGSTNAEALADPTPWQLVTAHEQTGGRGRHARAWASPAGSSVAMSMTVPVSSRPADLGWLPLLTGLAVRDALVDVTGAPDDFSLKWPNDVLACETPDAPGRAELDRAHGVDPDRPDDPAGPGEGIPTGDGGDDGPPAGPVLLAVDGSRWAKLCGILCQVAPGGLVVAGIGVNVTVPLPLLPVAGATSLHACGVELGDHPREDVLVAIARRFADVHADWVAGGARLAARKDAYRAACLTLGRPVRLHLPTGPAVDGTAVGVADGGELRVRHDGPGGDGRESLYAAGDVVHVRPRGAAGSQGAYPHLA